VYDIMHGRLYIGSIAFVVIVVAFVISKDGWSKGRRDFGCQRKNGQQPEPRRDPPPSSTAAAVVSFHEHDCARDQVELLQKLQRREHSQWLLPNVISAAAFAANFVGQWPIVEEGGGVGPLCVLVLRMLPLGGLEHFELNFVAVRGEGAAATSDTRATKIAGPKKRHVGGYCGSEQ
jgi:hypothetical protein